jgi:hypothetical protein
MSTPESVILFPEKKLRIGDHDIVVREMNHHHAVAFLTVAGKYIGQFFTADGKPNVTPESIGEMVRCTAELSEALLEGATGRKATEFPISVSLEILPIAIELNLSPEILEKGKKLAGRFQDVAGFNPAALARPARPSAKPTTSSAKAGNSRHGT